MGSFKLKLVAYFSLIALLPFAAAFSGLEAVTDRNETRRVDGTLETSVRAAQAAFVEEVDQAERVATRLAGDPVVPARPRHAVTASGSRALAARNGVRIEPPRREADRHRSDGLRSSARSPSWDGGAGSAA